jgi:phosphatidylserine/phosphatidylglycerophosphate/cardiolipin synthase-like enzyme
MGWKTTLSLFIIGFLLGIFVDVSTSPKNNTPITAPESPVVSGVYFSLKGGCENQVIYWINKANISIHILIYSFTLDSIGNALIEAHSRSVEVKVVFEKSQIGQGSEYQKLRSNCIEVRNDTNPDFMHDKIMIVDGKVILTGSFNWSNNAENSNNENLVVITGASVASTCESEFHKIWNSAI